MKIRRAMLFAAGLGERLRPLTLKTPKPLLPIGEKPILDYSLAYLKRFGVEEVVINTSWLAEKIERHVGDGKKFGIAIHFSREEKPLGTAGGLRKARRYFENEPAFFTLNSDTLINCDLNELTQFHEEQKLPATVVVVPWQEGYGRLQVGNGRLLNIGGESAAAGGGDHLFTGLTILSPVIFSVLSPSAKNLITEGILPLMNKVKGIAAFVHDSFWRDIGSRASYEAAQEEWAAGHHPRAG